MEMTSATSCETPGRDSSVGSVPAKSVYQPHLDGLRAVAILGVLFEHFGLPLPDMLRCGPLSVRFFFVLTGYFITLSLWRVKAQIAESNGKHCTHLGRYYLARLLRIGPPFYLALAVGALLGIDEVRTNFFWIAAFQTNNYIAYLGYWPDSISHFWSLAVQEQFYMLWPIVVLTLPRRWFMPAMAGFILFGLGFRIWCIVTEQTTILRWVTIFGCIDSFAVGALVAWLKQTRRLDKIPTLHRTVLFAMPLVAFGCFFMGRALVTLPEGHVSLALAESFDSVFLAWLLIAALGGIKSRYGMFLCWTPMVYLGRISYGVYVYHVFVIVLVSPLLAPYGFSEDHYAYGRIAVLLGITLLLSSLSWHFLEQPFLAWKSALEKRPKAKQAAPLPLPEPSYVAG